MSDPTKNAELLSEKINSYAKQILALCGANVVFFELRNELEALDESVKALVTLRLNHFAEVNKALPGIPLKMGTAFTAVSRADDKARAHSHKEIQDLCRNINDNLRDLLLPPQDISSS